MNIGLDDPKSNSDSVSLVGNITYKKTQKLSMAVRSSVRISGNGQNCMLVIMRKMST